MSRPTPTPEEQKLENAKATLAGGDANSSSLTYDNVMQENYSIERRIHILACATLGLNDEDHEDDDEAKPLEDVLLALIHQSNNDLIREIEGKVEALRQDERPVDSHTGEPVETYGYEVTNNEVVNQVKQILTNAIKGEK